MPQRLKRTLGMPLSLMLRMNFNVVDVGDARARSFLDGEPQHSHALTVLRDHGVQEVVLGFFPRWEKGLKCGARLFQSLRLQPRARRHLVLGIGWDRVGSPRRELGVRDWAEDWHEWLLGA